MQEASPEVQEYPRRIRRPVPTERLEQRLVQDVIVALPPGVSRREVYRHVVGPRHEVFDARCSLPSELCPHLGGGVSRVEKANAHTERLCCAGDLAPNVAEAENTERLTLDLVALSVVLLPDSLPTIRIRLKQTP